MRILFATAELAPIAAVGGLAAAAAGLGRALRSAGVDVDLVLPDYGGITLADEDTVELRVPGWVGGATARTGRHADVGALTLLSVPGMARPHPYLQADGSGWSDNDERFFRFAAAVAAWCRHTEPDVLHLNDWHTGPALADLVEPPPTVVSIHNLAYQGTTSPWWLGLIGLRGHHYEWWGATNPLSGALALADRIVAVSPNYAREITTPEGGFGLDGPLSQRSDALIGILNGIDTDVWNPAADPHLPATYDHTDLDGKAVCRSALHGRLGFDEDRTPLATIVTRLTDQKGVDLLVPAIELLDQVPMRLGVLGSGDAWQAAELRSLAERFPERVAFVEGYDEALSHLMFAGADAFVMPSRFEPCGLTQMQAMRYGALPVVTSVGGLVDTVPDVDAQRTGLGVRAARAEPMHLLAALFRAARVVRDERRRRTVQRRIMQVDWSWSGPAATYQELYESLLAER